MVLNSISVGAAVTPTVVETYFSHYLNRKPLREKPTAHVSYHEGLNLIRQFLHYASLHTVEDIQGFTSQWVPTPRWVKVEEVTIPEDSISKAADALTAQLGHHGVDKIGGSKWWQWRRDGNILKAEWIEMRAHYAKRKQSGEKSKRIMLYVHGGAYFFGSVDEHRYQMQRHARKLEARVFARDLEALINVTRYRLAPQFPFPCGLHDCLAAYLYLLTEYDPSSIILAGDSAGGGMVVSMLVILRDRDLPLPAGAVLISPWVDLTHSFPSLSGDGSHDYIPSHGFMQRPSASWPPPNSDDMEQIAMHAVEKVVGEGMPRKSTQHDREVARESAIQGFTVDHHPTKLKPVENANNPAGSDGASERPGNTIPGPGHGLSIMLDGKLVTIKDQIQMYASNQLISHPLVSPVLSPTLGGLPPLLILSGGGELLRDEQIYLAHKAANPSRYPPGEAYLDQYPEARRLIEKYKPTDVQLQVWDDLCHVAPTLSFTRPAKYMYRSIAQFGAWALARAQKTEIEIMDDDEVSVITSGSETDSLDSDLKKPVQKPSTMDNGILHGGTVTSESVGKAGKPLPRFKGHMIRQRVDRHGGIFPLDPPSSLPALQMPANEIGVIKPGPVQKWLAAKKEWDSKFAREKRKVQKQRIKEMAQGYQGFGDDEVPPPSALAGRRGLSMPKEDTKKRSWGMSLWALWGSKHDESTMEREEKADKQPETAVTAGDGTDDHKKSGKQTTTQRSRSRSQRRAVSYDESFVDQNDDLDGEHSVAELLRLRKDQKQTSKSRDRTTESVDPTFLTLAYSPKSITFSEENRRNTEHTEAINTVIVNGASQNRPAADGKLFPFKLGKTLGEDGANASTLTLTSQAGVVTPKGDEKIKKVGEPWAGMANGTGVVTRTSGEHDRMESERPNMERFETAKEDL